jgi:hypothetical protein
MLLDIVSIAINNLFDDIQTVRKIDVKEWGDEKNRGT